MAAQDRKCRVCGIVIPPSNDSLRCYSCRGKARLVAAGKSVEAFLSYKLVHTKARAKRKGQEYDIVVKDLLDIYEKQKGYCSLSGLAMTHTTDNSDLSISIDRIDNSRGYTVDNVALTCWRANYMRSNLTPEMFTWWCKQIAKD